MQELKEQLKQAEAAAEEARYAAAYAAGTRHGGGARCEANQTLKWTLIGQKAGGAGGAGGGRRPRP